MIGRSLRVGQGSIFAVAIATGVLAAGASVRAQTERIRSLLFDGEKSEWVEDNPPRPDTAEGVLYEAARAVRTNEYRLALRYISDFDKKYGEAHELYPTSLIVRTRALVGLKRFDDADATIQGFLAQFSGSALTADAHRLQLVIAENYLGGAKRRAWVIFRVSGEDRGLTILDEIITHPYVDSELAPLAIKTKADHLFKTGQHLLAELEYARLMRDYPQSRYHEYSLSRTAEAALSSFGGADYDEAALIEAAERYGEYQSAYPGSAARAGVEQIQESIREMRAEKDLRIGEYYEKTEHADTAAFYYRNVRRDFPDSLAAARAAERLSLLGVPVEAAGN